MASWKHSRPLRLVLADYILAMIGGHARGEDDIRTVATSPNGMRDDISRSRLTGLRKRRALTALDALEAKRNGESENDVDKLRAWADKVCGWFENQAARNEQSARTCRFQNLIDGYRADAHNYRVMAKDGRAALEAKLVRREPFG